MPVKRRQEKSRLLQISEEMVTTWIELHDIIATGDDQFWEQDGGRLERFYTLNSRLNCELLHRGPHEVPVSRMITYKIPDDEAGWARCGLQAWQRESYEFAAEIAQLLDDAVEAQHHPRSSPQQPVRVKLTKERATS